MVEHERLNSYGQPSFRMAATCLRAIRVMAAFAARITLSRCLKALDGKLEVRERDRRCDCARRPRRRLQSSAQSDICTHRYAPDRRVSRQRAHRRKQVLHLLLHAWNSCTEMSQVDKHRDSCQCATPISKAEPQRREPWPVSNILHLVLEPFPELAPCFPVGRLLPRLAYPRPRNQVLVCACTCKPCGTEPGRRRTALPDAPVPRGWHPPASYRRIVE